jgi:hypothetical protein
MYWLHFIPIVVIAMLAAAVIYGLIRSWSRDL